MSLAVIKSNISEIPVSKVEPSPYQHMRLAAERVLRPYPIRRVSKHNPGCYPVFGGGRAHKTLPRYLLAPCYLSRLVGAVLGDTAKYRALGNAVAVPVVEWIAKLRINGDMPLINKAAGCDGIHAPLHPLWRAA